MKLPESNHRLYIYNKFIFGVNLIQDGYYLVSFVDIELRFDVVLEESNFQHVLQ